ncbi:HlyD family type I secretion periplasmic adaptor subunit [Sphingomonas sp. LY160]|uniref:HlyD family type I secretion periplasmic adaptor subunit n=1 Tax=Sphingomonas sp. LY160 TaxID=3095342 RepID=UPI002ADEE302|nr:HlyD family type I secretion periplasmic adaptor subunit [Sphingomonas sp. LY160]MEA1072606.1 HlyD family type I secretion periplasmic adaptor subunit [Sphingomonas sp. LY160]
MNELVAIDGSARAVTPLDDVANPKGDIRTGLIIAGLFFILFLGWAAFARLDAAAHAGGTLIVSGQRQSVQHRDGGVVGQINVREGQQVERGQLLFTLAAAEVQAQERALTSQAIRLLATRARLEAEQAGRGSIATPPEFALFAEADRPEAQRVLRFQQVELNARAATLAAQRGALSARASQSGAAGRGYGTQTASTEQQIKLIDDQIAALRPVADKGFVSQTRLRELERAKAALEGQRGQFSASIASSAGASRESELMRLEASQSFRERISSDLREVEQLIGDVMPKLAAARDQLARTSIRAPVTGTVVGLTVFTPGGVVSAGQKLMDIVPDDTPLVVQAQISPDNADDLRPGQEAEVRFPGIKDRSIPPLKGEVTRVSADSFTDEASGMKYFTGEVVVPRDQLALLKDADGRPFKLTAGMPVEVLVRLRKRTALDYFLEPLTSQFWGAMREE